MAGGNVAVPELRVKEKPLLGPKSVQRLVGLKSFVREQSFLLLRYDERGVHVESGCPDRISFLDGGGEVCIDLLEGA